MTTEPTDHVLGCYLSQCVRDLINRRLWHGILAGGN
jgi:hypothetical protein